MTNKRDLLYLPAFLLVCLGASQQLDAQDFLCLRSSGAAAKVRWTGLIGKGADLRLRMQVLEGAESGQVQWSPAQVLMLCGAPPRLQIRPKAVVAHLVGGAEWHGELLGSNDKDGETFMLASDALGQVRLSIDRLATLVFLARASGSSPARFALSKDQADEVLFRRARRGFDAVGGEIDRFGSSGIEFVRQGTDAPQLFPYDSLVALSVRDGDPAQTKGSVQLLTTSGDRLLVDLLGLKGGRLEVAWEGLRLGLPIGRVAGLAFLASNRSYLADLPVQRADEAGCAAGLGKKPSPPLFSFARDRTCSRGVLDDQRRSVADGALVAAGRAFVKGLGVHARSGLTFRVPPECRYLQAWVAIDDEVKELSVRGDADVQIRVGEQVLFEKKGLRRGMPPIPVRVPVKPGSLVTLQADFGKGLFLGDRVDWLGAAFLR